MQVFDVTITVKTNTSSRRDIEMAVAKAILESEVTEALVDIQVHGKRETDERERTVMIEKLKESVGIVNRTLRAHDVELPILPRQRRHDSRRRVG